MSILGGGGVLGGSSQDLYVVRITPMYKPFRWLGRGPTTRSLGDEHDHHGFFYHISKSWDNPLPVDPRFTFSTPSQTYQTKTNQKKIKHQLVGGFQPIWKILVKIGIFPQIVMKIKKIFELPPPRSEIVPGLCFSFWHWHCWQSSIFFSRKKHRQIPWKSFRPRAAGTMAPLRFGSFKSMAHRWKLWLSG